MSKTPYNEYKFSDYSVFETAQGDVNNLVSVLNEEVQKVKASVQVISQPDVFTGKVADSCKEALGLLNRRLDFSSDNFSKIAKYFSDISDEYKKGDEGASKAASMVLALDENGHVIVGNAISANAFVDPSTGWVWPLGKGEKWVLTSHNDGGHHGIDIATYQKQGAPIYSPMGGTVIASGWNSAGYGNWVKVRLDNGLIAIFGHMSNSQPAVKPGQKITAGQMIGNVGSTGNSSGPHIHFELRDKNDTGSLDPLAYYPGLKKV